MENYDIREQLHKTTETQLSRLLGSFSHLLGDSKISLEDGSLQNVDINAFQLKIHHLSIIKAIQVFLQIAADLDLSSALLDSSSRMTEVEDLRRTLDSQISSILSPSGVVSQQLLNRSYSHQEEPSLEDDDDVVFEGTRVLPFGLSGGSLTVAEPKPANPIDIPPRIRRQDLFIFP